MRRDSFINVIKLKRNRSPKNSSMMSRFSLTTRSQSWPKHSKKKVAKIKCKGPKYRCTGHGTQKLRKSQITITEISPSCRKPVRSPLAHLIDLDDFAGGSSSGIYMKNQKRMGNLLIRGFHLRAALRNKI